MAAPTGIAAPLCAMETPRDAPDAPAGAGCDPALLPFLQAADGQADGLLADLLSSRVGPTVREAVRRALSAWQGDGAVGQDLEDISSDAMMRVLRALRDLRADAEREPIQNLEAYAARVASHACHEYFRRRSPQRTRLRNRVWYLLSRDPTLTLDRTPTGGWRSGLAAAGDGRGRIRPRPTTGDRRLRDLVCALLVRHGRALELNELVDLVARELGIRDLPGDGSAGGAAADVDSLPDRGARPPLDTLERLEYLARLWTEIRGLPLRQRTALLLNLRDAAGGDALDLLPLTGTASLREIAGALDMDAEDLARLWPALPLDDRHIAERLGVSRQQVINLRKAARARLGRRLSVFATMGGPAGNTTRVYDSAREKASLDT